LHIKAKQVCNVLLIRRIGLDVALKSDPEAQAKILRNVVAILAQRMEGETARRREQVVEKVQYEQEGGIELDAYPGRDFLFRVTEIDPAATIVDGVPKYRIKLDFLENEEESLKIGMTGDVDIITGIEQ